MKEAFSVRKMIAKQRNVLLAALAVIGLILGLGAWGLSSAVGSSPDEDFHLASIWCGLGDREALCASTTEPGHRLIESGLNRAACYAFEPEVSAGCQSALGIFANSEVIDSTRGSFSANYPPVFYATMGIFASPDIEASVMVMRFVNVLVFAGSFIALLLLLPIQLRRTQFWMWAATVVPLGTFLIASVNPSSWAITGVGTSWIALYGFFRSSGKRQFGLGILFIFEVLIASGARADAAIYTIIGSALVIALSWRRERAFVLQLLLPFIGASIALAFYSMTLQAGVASTGLADGELDVSGRSSAGVLAANLIQLPMLWIGAFGYWGLGWLDTEMPALVWVSSVTVVIGLIFYSRKSTTRRENLALLVLGIILYALPLYVLQKGLNHVGEQVQPRYILPLIIVFAGIAFLSFARKGFSLTRLQSIFVIVLLVIANSLALFVNSKRYVSGISRSSGFSLNSNVEWWWNIPLDPMMNWFIGSIGFAVAVILGFLILAKPKNQKNEVINSLIS